MLHDTHAFLWWLTNDPALTITARKAIAERANQVRVRAASAWEITTKHRIGKLPAAGLLVRQAGKLRQREGAGLGGQEEVGGHRRLP